MEAVSSQSYSDLSRLAYELMANQNLHKRLRILRSLQSETFASIYNNKDLFSESVQRAIDQVQGEKTGTKPVLQETAATKDLEDLPGLTKQPQLGGRFKHTRRNPRRAK